MKRARRSESGQVFVILVLVLFGLIGFTALAIDGGMIYSERRRAQNAADAGALAAALAKTQSGNLHDAALNRITSNGYDTSWGPCDPAGNDCTLGSATNWTAEVTNPPREGDFSGLDEYIHVVITVEVEPAFAHLFFKDGLQTTVNAVSRVWPGQNIKPGYALYGAAKTDCKGIWFSGTGNTTISGGSVFSNSDADSASCQSGVQDGNGDVSVAPPDNIQVVGNFDQGGSGSVDPQPVQEGVPQENLRPIPEPDCSGLTDYGDVMVNAGNSATLQPGKYESISFKANASVTLEPGMYCVYGSKGFTGNGGSITGTDIMIYMQDGGLDMGGNSLVALAAVDPEDGDLMDPSMNDWAGMLIYFDPSNSNEIKLTGTTGSTYTGTIYAESSECTINGTGDNIGLLSTQIICDKIKITGTAQVDIQYDEAKVYSLPPAIDLAR
jgi:hypothetical protein